mgnify:CR=1 FL=1
MVEPPAHNRTVTGSTPVGSTNKLKERRFEMITLKKVENNSIKECPTLNAPMVKLEITRDF